MSIALVVKGDLFPELDDTVLEIFKLPEQRLVHARVGVPVLVLSSRHGVQVQHHIEVLCGAAVDDTVEDAEAVLRDHARV